MIKIPEGVVAESIPNDVLKVAIRKSYKSAHYRLDDHHKAEEVANDIALTHYNYLEEQKIFEGDEPNWKDPKCQETYGVKSEDRDLIPFFISIMYLTKQRAFGYAGNSGVFASFDSDSFGSGNLDNYLVRLEFEHIYNFAQETIVDAVEEVYQQALSNARESLGGFEFIDLSKAASDDAIVANYCRDKMLDEISCLEKKVKSHSERCLSIGIKEAKANAFSYAYTQFRANVSDLIMAQLKENFGDIQLDGISKIIGSKKDYSNKLEPYVKNKSITLTSSDTPSAYTKAHTFKECVTKIDTWFFDQSVREGHVFYDENNHSLSCSLDDAPYSIILKFIEFMQGISRKTGLNFDMKILASVLVQKKSHAFEKVEIDAGLITPFRICTNNLEEILKPVVRTVKELESFSVGQEA